MDAEAELVKETAINDTIPKSSSEENEYKFFDYFKEHTGLLVTCVSALVAIMSCIFHYAVSRMNYAYLAYWEISALHANTNNQNELYMVASMLMYAVALMLINGFLGKTSNAFRYHSEFLSTVSFGIKFSNKTIQKIKKDLDKTSYEWEHLLPEEKDSALWKAKKEEVNRCYELLEKNRQSQIKIKKARGRLIHKVTIQIVLAVIFSYLMGSLFLVIINMASTLGDSLRLSRTVLFIIIADLIGYFLPEYFAARRASKQYENEEIFDRLLEMADSEIPRFPVENMVNWKIKTMFTDKMLKSASILLTTTMILLLMMMPFLGTVSAEHKRSFPIYTDGSTSYAIVYFSGSTVFMEEAIVHDGSLSVDTTKQRILTNDDLAYDIIVFEDVTIIRNEEVVDTEENDTFSMNDMLDAVRLLWGKIKTMIGEMMVEHEGNVSRK